MEDDAVMQSDVPDAIEAYTYYHTTTTYLLKVYCLVRFYFIFLKYMMVILPL